MLGFKSILRKLKNLFRPCFEIDYECDCREDDKSKSNPKCDKCDDYPFEWVMYEDTHKSCGCNIMLVCQPCFIKLFRLGAFNAGI